MLFGPILCTWINMLDILDKAELCLWMDALLDFE